MEFSHDSRTDEARGGQALEGGGRGRGRGGRGRGKTSKFADLGEGHKLGGDGPKRKRRTRGEGSAGRGQKRTRIFGGRGNVLGESLAEEQEGGEREKGNRVRKGSGPEIVGVREADSDREVWGEEWEEEMWSEDGEGAEKEVEGKKEGEGGKVEGSAEDGMVACPICGDRMEEGGVSGHLDSFH